MVDGITTPGAAPVGGATPTPGVISPQAASAPDPALVDPVEVAPLEPTVPAAALPGATVLPTPGTPAASEPVVAPSPAPLQVQPLVVSAPALVSTPFEPASSGKSQDVAAARRLSALRGPFGFEIDIEKAIGRVQESVTLVSAEVDVFSDQPQLFSVDRLRQRRIDLEVAISLLTEALGKATPTADQARRIEALLDETASITRDAIDTEEGFARMLRQVEEGAAAPVAPAPVPAPVEPRTFKSTLDDAVRQFEKWIRESQEGRPQDARKARARSRFLLGSAMSLFAATEEAAADQDVNGEVVRRVNEASRLFNELGRADIEAARMLAERRTAAEAGNQARVEEIDINLRELMEGSVERPGVQDHTLRLKSEFDAISAMVIQQRGISTRGTETTSAGEVVGVVRRASVAPSRPRQVRNNR